MEVRLLRLVRVGEEDFSEYIRTIRKLDHSINPTNEIRVSKEYVDKIIQANRNTVFDKSVFIDNMKDPNIEAYFLKDNEDKIIGIVFIKFEEKMAFIVDFGILSQYKGHGIGTAFFNMVLNESIVARQCKLITLRCPFFGAQIFWQKLGFKIVVDKEYYIGNPLMKKRL